MLRKKYRLLIIGGSAGSLEIIFSIINSHKHLTLPVIIVVHRKDDANNLLVELLASKTSCPVKEAEDKEPIIPGIIYIAPPDYHLLVEKNESLSLDLSEKINYSRPSIDACFETAAEAYRDQVVCVLLSGANSDGADGLKKIKEYGGLTVVQNPLTADVPFMPEYAILKTAVHHIVDGARLPEFIQDLLIWNTEI